jgi:hypothetical protein
MGAHMIGSWDGDDPWGEGGGDNQRAPLRLCHTSGPCSTRRLPPSPR